MRKEGFLGSAGPQARGSVRPSCKQAMLASARCLPASPPAGLGPADAHPGFTTAGRPLAMLHTAQQPAHYVPAGAPSSPAA